MYFIKISVYYKIIVLKREELQTKYTKCWLGNLLKKLVAKIKLEKKEGEVRKIGVDAIWNYQFPSRNYKNYTFIYPK